MNEDPSEPKNPGRLRAEERSGLVGQDSQLKEKTSDPEQSTLELEERWEHNPTNIIGRAIMIVLSGLILLTLAGCLIYSFLTPPFIAPPKKNAPPPLFIETATPSQIETAVRQSVMGFMNAQNHSERAQHLIGGKTKISQLHNFYQRPENTPPKGFSKIQKNEISAFQGIPMHSVFALEADQKSGWFLNLLPTQTGMKIDWESSVAYSDISWFTFLTEKPTTPVTMRIYLSRSGKNNTLMLDQNIAFCKIFQRGNDQSLPGFFQVKSPIAPLLKKIIPPGGRQPIKAKIRWNKQGSAIEIIEVLHNFWIDIAHYEKALLQPTHESPHR